MALPRATDEEMMAALARLPEDDQIAFMARLMDTAYAKLANEPRVNKWISLHADRVGELIGLANFDEPDPEMEDWQRRNRALWRIPFKWLARRVISRLAYPRMPNHLPRR